MLDDSIIAINEVAKLKTLASSSGGGGAGTQFSQNIDIIAKRRTSISTLDVSAALYTSTNYAKGMNHGGGQFSFASTGYYRSSWYSTATRQCVVPFTVNQTTGALTVATPQNVWTNTSGGCTSTNTWGVSGSYGFNLGNHCGPGQTSNVPVISAWTVSNNTVSGATYSNVSSYQPTNNSFSGATRSGSTAYWGPSVYNGTAYQYVWSYNGSSLSNTVTSSLSSNTSTMYTPLVIPQYGSVGTTSGLILYQDGSGLGKIKTLDSTSSVTNTLSTKDIIGTSANANYDNTTGFQLSNGKVLYFLPSGSVLLQNGTTVTDVSAEVKYKIAARSIGQHSTPAGVDSWYTVSEERPAELVKWSINPTTLDITILGSVLLTPVFNDNESARWAAQGTGGVWVTGSSNQYIVGVSYTNTYAGGAIITVGTNPLAGA